MSDGHDDLVTVAVLANETEATLVKNRLEGIGIKAFISGEEAVAMSWHMTTAFGGIKVQVPATDARDARRLLRKKPWQEPLPEDQESFATGETLEKIQQEGEDEDDTPSEREKTADRAVRASIGGLLFLPIEAYAAWLLSQIVFSSEKLEGRSRTNAKVAGYLTVSVILTYCLAAWMFIRGPVERPINLRELPHPDVLLGKWEGTMQKKKGDSQLFMQLKSTGTIRYRESGADESEASGTWAYKDFALLIVFDTYNQGNKHLQGKLLEYLVEDVEPSKMILHIGKEKVPMTRIP